MPTIHPRYECILFSIQRIRCVIFPTLDDSQSSRIGGGSLQIVYTGWKKTRETNKSKRRDSGLAQIESDAELAQRLHEEELAELDKARKERQKQEEATSATFAEEFDEIQAKIDADHELAKKETIGSRKSRGNKEQTTYKNSSQEQDDYLPQTYGANGSSKNYKIFSEMLDDFDRQDV
ncbi:hypothetical protein Tco_1313630 [Tanacetum coccineum]